MINRIEKQQARGVPDARGIEAGGPLAPRHRRERVLRRRARELAQERGFESRDGVGERHGTSVIAVQVLCGLG